MIHIDSSADDTFPLGSARARAQAAWGRRQSRPHEATAAAQSSVPRAACLPAATTPIVDGMARHEHDHFSIARRMRALRTLGLGLGGLMVGATLYDQGAGLGWFVALALQAFAWPQLAWLCARRAAAPRRAERVNLLVDCAAGGLWIAAMQLAVVPSAVLVAMLLCAHIAADGWRFALRALAVMMACFLPAWTALGWPISPLTALGPLIAAVPLLIAFPLALGEALYTSERRAWLARRELKGLNRVDTLTKLGNRAAFEEAVRAELSRSKRSRRPASLLLLDIDDFKQLNDRHGSAYADEVLRRVASIVQGALRDIEAAFRYGGDEFAVILPETDKTAALRVAERIRAAAATQRCAEVPELRCTVSIGVAEVIDATGANQWIERADHALYAAKAAGRDAVRSASLH